MLLRDKVAVVYGAGGAIGGAVAHAFADEGARVFLAGRTLGRVEVVAKEIGASAQAAEVDALDERAVDEHLQDVMAAGTSLGGAVSYSPMLCAHCASPLPDGSRFCVNCGADLEEPSSGATASLDDAGVVKLTRMLREETAGEYEIERELARGGMGVVYVATEIQLRRRVAIKVLPPTLTFGEAAIQRFRREARTAAALDHPNIIPIYRVSSGGELMWYSMKLLEGKSLDTLLKAQEHLAFESTVAVLEQVADALDYAHQHGVIHRDIKPGNIVLDDRGRVTVTDFGIAKELQEGSLSASGSLLGTPYYMAPEQYIGGDISGAADQYSLCPEIRSILWLSSEEPFWSVWMSSVTRKIVPPQPLAITVRTCSAVSPSITGGPGISISWTAKSGWFGGPTVSHRKCPSSASVTSARTSKPTFFV